MHRGLPLLLRAIAYGLRGGFLIRPFLIALVLGAVGGVLSSLEEQVPTLSAWVPTTLFPSRQDPQVAQVILSAIATSIMTVVSIVFAILLMTLTLASTQFSPRILVSFVRDRGTQWTLGCSSAPSPIAWPRCRRRARFPFRSCRCSPSPAPCCWRWSPSAG